MPARPSLGFAVAPIPALALLVVSLGAASAADGVDACKLLTPAELESAVGAKVGLPAQAAASPAGASLCSGQAGARRILIRVGTRTGKAGSSEKEKAGLEAVKKMGGRVEVTADGPLTCSTLVPPASHAAMGFNTACSVVKGERVVAVEVTAASEADMLPMARLRPLVGKAAGRL